MANEKQGQAGGQGNTPPAGGQGEPPAHEAEVQRAKAEAERAKADLEAANARIRDLESAHGELERAAQELRAAAERRAADDEDGSRAARVEALPLVSTLAGGPVPGSPEREVLERAQASWADEHDENALWVHSNRQDDRVVLWEQDPRHPGGEAFVGGSGAVLVYRTARVEQLLRDGLLVEILDPPMNRKRPVPADPQPPSVPLAMPGQPIRLGRQFDPEVVPPQAQEAVQRMAEARRVPSMIEPPQPVPERVPDAQQKAEAKERQTAGRR